tara:strand:+ start:599 stop:823 length:225 start_codon:yes stop_codon:yes gene_type:complete
MIKYYFIGVIILISAIIANIIAAKIGLKTWYDFLNAINNDASLSTFDYIWLFALYPLTLGLSVKFGLILWDKLF